MSLSEIGLSTLFRENVLANNSGLAVRNVVNQVWTFSVVIVEGLRRLSEVGHDVLKSPITTYRNLFALTTFLNSPAS